MPSASSATAAAADRPSLRIKTRTSPRSPEAWDRFLDLLQARYQLLRDNENPDYVIAKRKNFPLAHFLCARLWYSNNEGTCGDGAEFVDGQIGYERRPHPHHVYLAEWMLVHGWQNVRQPVHNMDALVRAKRHFCAFIHDSAWPFRSELYEHFARHRRLDSLGDALRNAPRPSGLAARYTKWDLATLPAIYRRYKFVLAFENASYPGYTSEKIFCALLGRAVPVYWGDPGIAEFINPACFINAHDFATPQALVAHVMKVDADDALYRRYLAAPVLRAHPLVDAARPENLQQQLADLFAHLRQARHQPRGVRSMFQRDCLSRLGQPAVQQLVPQPRFGFQEPQDWNAPRRFLARGRTAAAS